MRQRVRDGFSILLPAADAVRFLGDNLKLSWIATAPQEYQSPRIILNLLAQSYEGTPSVNNTMDREFAL